MPERLILLSIPFCLVACYESVSLDEEGNVIEKEDEPGRGGEDGTDRDSDTRSTKEHDNRGDTDGASSQGRDTNHENPSSGLDCVSANAGLCDDILCDFQEAWDDFMEECRLSELDCSGTEGCYEANLQCFLYACPPGSIMNETQIDMLNRCLELLSECIG